MKKNARIWDIISRALAIEILERSKKSPVHASGDEVAKNLGAPKCPRDCETADKEEGGPPEKKNAQALFVMGNNTIKMGPPTKREAAMNK